MTKNFEIYIIELPKFEKYVNTRRKSEKIKIAQKMLKDNINIDIIIKFTELTKEEIEKLKN